MTTILRISVVHFAAASETATERGASPNQVPDQLMQAEAREAARRASRGSQPGPITVGVGPGGSRREAANFSWRFRSVGLLQRRPRLGKSLADRRRFPGCSGRGFLSVVYQPIPTNQTTS